MTQRGRVLRVTPEQAIARARSAMDPIPSVGYAHYSLAAGQNGGSDPTAASPASIHGGRATCDCVGLVCWALGFDRLQRGEFAARGGWCNTDSMIAEAAAPGAWFEQIGRPEIGAVLVYPSTYQDGRRLRAGHVGLISAVPAEWAALDDPGLSVIHCSLGNDRRTGRAILETSAAAWHGRASRILRYVRLRG